MTWKRSIDDIKVVCKICDEVMIIESSMNNSSGLFICPKCDERVNVRVK